MKIEFSVLFGFVIFMMFTPRTSAYSYARPGSRRMPGYFHGACSARLMDTLHMVCGPRGVGLSKNIYLMRRYRSRMFRRNGGNSGRRGRRAAENVEGENVDGFVSAESMTFVEARQFLYRHYSPLSSIVRAGKVIHSERTEKKRVRRQISHDCCKRNCSQEFIRRKYCNSRFG